MPNVLKKEKQQVVVGALVEGSSIRSTERMTGVHRDTIMRLMLRVGDGCEALMDSELRNLGCRRIQVDELWGFVQKKQRHVRANEDPNRVGDFWTFVAIDADSKLVPTFRLGKRDRRTAWDFMQDVASRVEGRVQISADALPAYIDAITVSFGKRADFGQIVKSYEAEPIGPGRYSPPKVVSAERRVVRGKPRPGPYLDQLHRAAEPDDQDAGPQAHPAHQCVQQEAREPAGRDRATLRALQLRSEAPDVDPETRGTAYDSGNGGRSYGSALDYLGPLGRRPVKLGHYPAKKLLAGAAPSLLSFGRSPLTEIICRAGVRVRTRADESICGRSFYRDSPLFAGRSAAATWTDATSFGVTGRFYAVYCSDCAWHAYCGSSQCFVHALLTRGLA